MQYENIKLEQIDKMPGVKSSVIVNGSIQSIEFSFGGFEYLISGNYGISLSKKKGDIIEDRYVVSGQIQGAEIKPKSFESKRDCDDFYSKLPEKNDLKIEKISWNVTKDCATEEKPTEINKEDCFIPF